MGGVNDVLSDCSLQFRNINDVVRFILQIRIRDNVWADSKLKMQLCTMCLRYKIIKNILQIFSNSIKQTTTQLCQI